MTNCKEILRLHDLGINNTRIAESCGCARSTVIAALRRAAEQELSWNKIKNCSPEEASRKLYPSTALGQQYKSKRQFKQRLVRVKCLCQTIRV